jgi:hypothetical protein
MTRLSLALFLAAASAQAAPTGALIAPQLWTTLPAPTTSALDWLSSRLPKLERGAVRELPFETVDKLLADAVARGYSSLDIFSDAGLREPGRIFYISQENAHKAFAKYRLRSLSMDAATAKDGKPFSLQAIVMGSGKIEMLYDRGGFDFDNPDYKGHHYHSADRVTEIIQGPGDLKVEGLSVNMLIHPKIQRFLKISDDKLRIETNWGNQDRPLKPVVLKSGA